MAGLFGVCLSFRSFADDTAILDFYAHTKIVHYRVGQFPFPAFK